jgi:hypothetical protein
MWAQLGVAFAGACDSGAGLAVLVRRVIPPGTWLLVGDAEAGKVPAAEAMAAITARMASFRAIFMKFLPANAGAAIQRLLPTESRY